MDRIVLATSEDKTEILALYRSMLHGPAAWDEHYPNEDTIDFDLSRDALYVMKNEDNDIIATISIDEDEEVNKLSCWNRDLMPWAELARLGVRADMRNQGIARKMMKHAFDVLKKQGKKSVHILVKKGNDAAFASYEPLGFKRVGECDLFGRDYMCLEMEL